MTETDERTNDRHTGGRHAARLALLAAAAGLAAAPAVAQDVEYVTGGDGSGNGMRIARTAAAGPPGEVWLPTGDFANSRYSELDQITTENVANLQVETTWSTGIPRGHEGQPLVVGDTMYVVTPYPNYLFAYDMTQPGFALKWKFEPHPDPTAVGKACCDIVNRGASYADGKIVYATLDTNVVAVDAEDGSLLWKTRLGNVEEGETTTMAAMIVKDKVIVGNSGGELGVRGWLKGLDLDTGEVLWTAYSTGTDEETLMAGEQFEPFYPKDQGEDLGVSSWPPDQWKLGGGTVWGWISYDPTEDLLYYGTGNPGVWNPDLRPGENKWSISIIARDPDDGQARWAWQVVPHDAWDYDEIMENILVDMPWNGEMRKLLVHPGRTGFVFVLDRVTGELLSAEKFHQATNWADEYDLETGYPLVNEAKRTHLGQTTFDICPSSTGAKEFVPSALSPRTGLLYIPAHNFCMSYKAIEANYIAGTPYLGADVVMKPGPGNYKGKLVAWDVAEAREVWRVEEPYAVYSGVLATAGDVVFYGTLDGWFKAVDATNGEELWKFKTGSGIVGNPITFLGPDGRQRIAIYSGIGGWVGANAFESISADDPTAALGTTGAAADLKKVTAPGDLLYVFSIPEQ
ncbi:MAG: PQQ-dependent dehydrogenase, methanol/ethanol family [Gammaproteobacteria bacterium]|nr:PQQ-dependent dehydrogenase, methanol/ethanol family [Gammaproteobacteria bacterium]